MNVEAARARSGGVLLSKFQRDSGWVQGHLLITEERDAELHRMCRVARLKVGIEVPDPFPQLFDATVIEMRQGWITVTGFERVLSPALGKIASYQQSWFIVPLQSHAAAASA